MFNLKLGEDHDIIIGRGATRVHGVEQVAQLVKCRLLTVFAEWEQDKNLGVPWFEGIFKKNAKLSDVQTALANVIRRTNGVLHLISLEVVADTKTRKLSVNFDALSVYGKLSDVVEWQTNTVSLRTAL